MDEKRAKQIITTEMFEFNTQNTHKAFFTASEYIIVETASQAACACI